MMCIALGLKRPARDRALPMRAQLRQGLSLSPRSHPEQDLPGPSPRRGEKWVNKRSCYY